MKSPLDRLLDAASTKEFKATQAKDLTRNNCEKCGIDITNIRTRPDGYLVLSCICGNKQMRRTNSTYKPAGSNNQGSGKGPSTESTTPSGKRSGGRTPDFRNKGK